MVWRRCVNIVAITGMLLYAGLFAYQSACALGAAAGDAALANVYGVICHANAAPAGSSADTPDGGQPQGHRGHCPLCLAALGGCAVLPAGLSWHIAKYQQAADAPIAEKILKPAIHAFWPPGRAPPFLS
jgi:hypothetical protein